MEHTTNVIEYYRHFLWLKQICQAITICATPVVLISAIMTGVPLSSSYAASSDLKTNQTPSAMAESQRPHSYAAAECIALAAQKLGCPMDTISLMSRTPWAADQIPTADAITNLAQSQKLQAQHLTMLTPEQLKGCPYPAILPVLGGRYSTSEDHFVLVVPTPGSDFNVISPPNDVRTVSANQLAQRWKGSAIVLAPQGSAPYLAGTAGHKLDVGGFSKIIGVLVLLLGIWLLGRYLPMSAASWLQRIGRSAIQALLLLTMAASISAIAWTFFDSQPVSATVAGRSGTNDPVEFFVTTASSVASEEIKIPELTEPEARALHAKGIQFIDARDLNEFNAGHIQGSLCVPASDVSRLRIYTAGLPKDQQLVVYCAIKNCGKGHYVANALAQEGFSQVVLYVDGWAKWTGPKER